MRRILVWGAPGTGKSTLARAIGARLGLPVIHLDAEYWRPGWVKPAQEEWLAQVTALTARDAWVMDGNYSATWDLRLPRAGAVVWLDLPRALYLSRTLRRTFFNWGRTRSDLGRDCPERFDWDFLRWTWTYPARTRGRTIATLNQVRNEKRVVILRSSAEVRRFCRSDFPF
ncbi:MAG TPA: AAA family ATPase [Hyphomicrobiaceae bacterium]|jgi:adenylate kinase family enzyme